MCDSASTSLADAGDSTEPLTFCRELDFDDDKLSVKICQEFVGDVGSVVWDSAILACYYFLKRSRINPFCGKKIIELGAGTGICSVLLSSLGADTLCTDLSTKLPLIVKNKVLNAGILTGSMTVQELDWCKSLEYQLSCEILLLVDCIYYRKALSDLIATIRSISFDEAICVYEKRDIGEPKLAQEQFFEDIQGIFRCEAIPSCDLDEDYVSEDIVAVRLIKLT